MRAMTVAVTGANGFVGTCLCDSLANEKCEVRRIIRRGKALGNSDEFAVGDFGSNTYWGDSLMGVDALVHLAARVHVMNDQGPDPLLEFKEVNTFGTINLAKAAAEQNVKRFIYVSSIKVNGEQTGQKQFTSEDKADPVDPYAISKYEAEESLKKIAKETKMEVVIIRPPLVYGPEVKANFLRLVRWVEKGIPLPLLSIKNKRSMVSVFNLVALIKNCIDHPRAAGETFLVSDGNDLSTAELIQHIAKAMNKPSRLFAMPVWALNALAKATGKTEEMRRLCGSLQVDISKAENVLGWVPPVSVEEGIQRTVDWFMEKNNKS